MQSNQDTNPVATDLAVKVANLELANSKLRVALKAVAEERDALKDKQAKKK